MRILKFILLALLIALLQFYSANAQSVYQTDLILTSTNAIWVDERAYATLEDAVTAVGANERTIIVASGESVTDLTIPSNITLKFVRGGYISNTGQLTLHTAKIISEVDNVFRGTGEIDFAVGTNLKSSWFKDLHYMFDTTNDNYVVLIINSGWSANVDADCAVGTNVKLKWNGAGNRIVVNSGFTLSGVSDITAGNYQIFSGSGDIDFLDSTELKTPWFPHFRYIINWVESETVLVHVIGTTPVSVTNTSPENITYEFDSGNGQLVPATGVTLTINGAVIARPNNNIFDITNGTINGAIKADKICVDWFGLTGAAIQAAVDVSESYIGEVYFPSRFYTMEQTVTLATGAIDRTILRGSDQSTTIYHNISVPSTSVVSITRSGTTATVTYTSTHDIINGDMVRISGCTQTEYNGWKYVTGYGVGTFTFTVRDAPATPATGSPACQQIVPMFDLGDDSFAQFENLTLQGYSGVSKPSDGTVGVYGINDKGRFQQMLVTKLDAGFLGLSNQQLWERCKITSCNYGIVYRNGNTPRIKDCWIDYNNYGFWYDSRVKEDGSDYLAMIYFDNIQWINNDVYGYYLDYADSVVEIHNWFESNTKNRYLKDTKKIEINNRYVGGDDSDISWGGNTDSDERWQTKYGASTISFNAHQIIPKVDTDVVDPDGNTGERVMPALLYDGREILQTRNPVSEADNDHSGGPYMSGAVIETDASVVKDYGFGLAKELTDSVRYIWTISGSGTNEYYVTWLAGADPGFGGEPANVTENGPLMSAGVVGSLSAGEWDWGDNDALGFSTIYVRLSDDADPDTYNAERDYVTARFNLGEYYVWRVGAGEYNIDFNNERHFAPVTLVTVMTQGLFASARGYGTGWAGSRIADGIKVEIFDDAGTPTDGTFSILLFTSELRNRRDAY